MLNHGLNHRACIDGMNFNVRVFTAKHPEYLPGNRWAKWLRKLRETATKRDREIRTMGHKKSDRVNPIRFFNKLDRHLQPTAQYQPFLGPVAGIPD